MSDLTTKYMGLDLQNPIAVASCNLSKNSDGIKRIADAGAGAVILKSLFEEQIKADTQEVEHYIGPTWHTEAYDYVQNMGMQLGPNEYLKLIENAKKQVSIPVIASLNCVSARWWTEYAKKLEKAGADGLELNISFLPSDPRRDSREVEKLYYKALDSVKSAVNIPIAVKLGPYFSSLANLSHELFRRGASALVLFNRFYQVDINIEKLTFSPGSRFSTTEEMSLPLRWIALLSDRVGCDFAATTGVYDAKGAIKMLLAGATVVQLCSTLYVNGLERISEILKELSNWMEKNQFKTVDQFRGKLSREQSEKPELLERLQYIKALVGVE
jgi:dihydroorotate dehydrogenase (fumarate)